MKEFDQLFELQKQLHASEIRSNSEMISRLFSENFCEFGSSGKTWTRETVLKSLPTEDGTTKNESSHYKATSLAKDVVLITYDSTRLRIGQEANKLPEKFNLAQE